MSLPPPGLGGGAARTGPPPGFGTSNASGLNPPTSAGGIGGGTRNNNGAASIVKAQIVFLLTTLTDESFEKASKELRDVSLLVTCLFPLIMLADFKTARILQWARNVLSPSQQSLHGRQSLHPRVEPTLSTI